MKMSTLTLGFLSLGFLNTFSYASQPILISDVDFNDPQFSLCVEKQNQPVLEKIKALNCNRMGIHSVDEIQFMPALKVILLSNNQIETIDTSAVVNLERLVIEGNQLSSLDLSSNQHLNFINVRNNQLKTLDLSQQSQLIKIKADYNQLSEIDFGSSEALVAVEMNNNQLTRIDVSQLTKLKEVIAFNNPLTDIILSSTNELELLSVEGTPYAKNQTGTLVGKGISNIESPRVSIIEGGLISKNDDKYDMFASQLVTPSVGQYIGIRYAVEPPIQDNDKAVDPHSKMRVKFPITVRMTHPEIIDPKTGKRSTVSSWTDTMFKHNNNLAMWYFGDKSELVSGRWTLEILYAGSVLAKRSFEVANLDELAAEKKRELESRKELLKVVLTMNKTLCGGAKFRRCMEFSSSDHCEVNIEPYKKRCMSIAFDKAKKQAEKGTSKDIIRMVFSHYTACIGSSYIQESKLDEKKVGLCFRQ